MTLKNLSNNNYFLNFLKKMKSVKLYLNFIVHHKRIQIINTSNKSKIYVSYVLQVQIKSYVLFIRLIKMKFFLFKMTL